MIKQKRNWKRASRLKKSCLRKL